MIDYIYVVHSDVDENNVYAEFDDSTEAVKYAKGHAEDQTWVEQIEVEKNDFGEVISEGNHETIWSYQDETEKELSDVTEKDMSDLDQDFNNISDDELAAIEKEHEDKLNHDPYEADEFEGHENLKEDSDPILDSEHPTAPAKDVVKKNLAALKAVIDPKMTNLQPKELKDDVLEELDANAVREEMEKNEADVECQECYNIVSKNECAYHEDKHGYICKECEEKLYMGTVEDKTNGPLSEEVESEEDAEEAETEEQTEVKEEEKPTAEEVLEKQEAAEKKLDELEDDGKTKEAVKSWVDALFDFYDVDPSELEEAAEAEEKSEDAEEDSDEDMVLEKDEDRVPGISKAEIDAWLADADIGESLTEDEENIKMPAERIDIEKVENDSDMADVDPFDLDW